MSKSTKNFGYSILLLVITLFTTQGGYSQDRDKKVVRETNKFLSEAEEAVKKNDFVSAEASYRKAISKDPSNTTARYNMGNLYYNEEKPSQAENRLVEAAELAMSKEEKHRAHHNLGNAYMNQENYQQAVEAYKNALRNDPTDEETRYNLALAKKMLEEQQDEEDEGGEGDDDQDQDQDENEQDQDQDGEGENDQNNQDKDGEPNDEENNEEDESQENQEEDEGEDGQPDEGEEGDEEQPQPQPSEGRLSPEQIQSLLEAMSNEERKVQDKINAEKAKGAKTRSEKDW